MLLGLYIKFLRCFEHLKIRSNRTTVGAEAGKGSSSRKITVDIVGMAGLVVGCLAYSLLLTGLSYPVSLYLVAFPITLISSFIFAMTKSEMCPLVRYNLENSGYWRNFDNEGG